MVAWTTFARTSCALAVIAVVTLELGACADGPRPGTQTTVPPVTAVRQPLGLLKPTEPPGDIGPIERFAWQRVVELGEAFAAGDAEGFLAKVSRGFYRGYGTLETSLKALLADSSARAAVVAVRKITEEEGRVSVRAEWTRTITRRDGSVDARHGETEFLFLKSDTSLRLLDYRGDTPFAIDGI